MKKFNEEVLKVGNKTIMQKKTTGDLVVVENGIETVLVPFEDDGTIEEVVLIEAYNELVKGVYELYTATFKYDDKYQMEEGDLKFHTYLVTNGDEIKVTNNI